MSHTSSLKTFNKCVTWLTALCFTGSSVFSQALFGVAMPGAADGRILVAEHQVAQAAIPSRYGRVTNGKFAGGERLVVYIQDLHCNPEVQNNIAKILESLDTAAGISRIFLEGAPAGKVEASLFDTVSDQHIRTGAIERLLSKGLLSGAEYYALTFKQNKLYGLEEWGPYAANLERYRKLHAAREESRKTVREIQKKIARLNWRYADKRIRRIAKAFEPEHSDTMYARIERLGARAGEPIGGYPNLARYVELLKLNRALRRKHKQVNKEMAAYVQELRKAVPMAAYKSLLDKIQDSGNRDEYYRELGEMGKVFAPALAIRLPAASAFFTSLRLQDQINPIHLIDEENEFRDRVLDQYARRVLDKDLVFLSRMAEDLGSYADLQMTPGGYAYFHRHTQRFKVLLEKYFAEAAVSDVLALLNNEEYSAFYATNVQRNDIFIKTVLRTAHARDAAARRPGATLADGPDAVLSHLSRFRDIDVVVAGGFHLDVVRKLKDDGVSCLMITPNVTRQYDQRIYEQVMTGTIDLRDVASSALAPVVRLTSGIDQNGKAAEIEALFAGVRTLEDAAKVINDLKTDNRYALEAVTDGTGNTIDIFINGEQAFRLVLNGTGVLVIAGKNETVADGDPEIAAATAAAVQSVLARIKPVVMTAPDEANPSNAPTRKPRYGKTTFALLRMIKNSFGKHATPQIVVSDMDESIVAAGGVIAQGMIEALISFLESGGIFVILTGNDFKKVQSSVLDQFMPVLRTRGKTDILKNFHILTNSGAELFQYGSETDKYEVVEQADMTKIVGKGDMAAGRTRMKKIHSIIEELKNGEWLQIAEKNPQVLGLIGRELNGYMDSLKGTDPAQFEHLKSLFPNLGLEDLRNMQVGEKSTTENRPINRDDLTVQIAFIPPGREIFPDEKIAYDRDGGALKRRAYAVYMNWRFNQEGISVAAKVGGTTSIDIKPIGQDKAFGIKAIVQHLAELLGEDPEALMGEVVYIGDSLDSMGNDTPAALVAGTVIHVRQEGAGEPDDSIKHKLIGTVETGVDSLVPYMNAMAFVAAIRTAQREGTSLSLDFDWRALPGALKKTYELFFSGQAHLHGSILPVRILAHLSLVWGAMGAVTLTPFLRMIYTDLVLAEALPGKAVLRVVPVANPSAKDLASVLHELKTVTRTNGLLGVAVALMVERDFTEGVVAGKIVVNVGDDELVIPVVHQEDEAGDILFLQVPKKYLRGKNNEQADAFLQGLYPVALHSLVQALTHGDIIAETTGVVPWLVEMNELELTDENEVLFAGLPVVVAKKPTPYKKLALEFKGKLLTPGQIQENNTGAGVIKQGALMIRPDMATLRDPIGDATDLVTMAKNFVTQFKGVADVQFDGLLSVDVKGTVTEDAPQVVKDLKNIQDGRIVLSLAVSQQPRDEQALQSLAEGIAGQLRGHKGLGMRIMFTEQPTDEDFQSFVSELVDSLVSKGIAPETVLIIDTTDKAQADAVRNVSMRSGMSGVKAIESLNSVKSASESTGDAVEVTIRLEDSDMPMPREQLIAIMSAPNAHLVVLHLEGTMPAVGEQGVLLNLGMICSAVTEYLSFRQPSDPVWWKERGGLVARSTYAEILRLTEGKAPPAAMSALAQALMLALTQDTALHKGMDGLDAETRDILEIKLNDMHELIDEGENSEVRTIRNGMIAGFLETLLGEVLYHQMPGIKHLNEDALEKSGESARLKKFLITLALSAGRDNADIPVLLGLMQAGIVPVPSDDAGTENLKQNISKYIDSHSGDHATVYSVLKCADALGLGVSSVSERFAVSDTVPVEAQPGSAEALLVEFLRDAETLKLDELRNKITAFLNQPGHDAGGQAMALGLYMVLLKTEFGKGVLEQGADIALPAVREVGRILSAA